MEHALQEFIAGWWGGVSGLLVGHPFDTVKSRLQTQGVGGREIRYRSTIHCFVNIVKTEGVHGLYKGITSPLLGMAAINATVFGVYGICMRQLQPQGGNPHLINSFIAGAAAGLVQSAICCPTELIKLRMQVQGIGQNKPSSKFWKKGRLPSLSVNYIGPWDTTKQIFAKEGIAGLCKGMVVTLWREAPAFGVYFQSYDLLCMLFSQGKSIHELGPMSLCLAGGISGINAWIITYPFDVVKSRIQVDGVQGPRQYNGMMDCFKKSYYADGWRVFFRGLNSTLVRAFPTNAATFSTFTYIIRYWRNDLSK